MKKILIFILILVLSFPPQIALANDSNEKVLEENDTREVIGEVEELRDINSKTYDMSDGTREWVGYSENIHYLDADNKYIEINNEIIESKVDGYKYTIKDNAWDIQFPNSFTDDIGIAMEYKGYTINFIPQDINTESIAEKTLSMSKSDSLYYEMKREDNRAVIYSNVYENVDFIYTSKATGVKEDIVLKNNNTKRVFNYNIISKELKPILKDNIVIFMDKDNNEIFQLEQLYMVDANGKYSNNLKYDIIENTDSFTLSIIADEKFLIEEDTAYPVIIDPTIMITGGNKTYDSYVSSSFRYSNYYLDNYLKTGNGSNSYYSYIKFNIPQYLSSYLLYSSFIRIKKYSGAIEEVKGYNVTSDWNSSTITWSNKPNYSSTYATTSVTPDTIGGWYRLNCTSAVESWIDGEPNNGFCLKATAPDYNGYIYWYSSDAPSPNKPELHISYKYILIGTSTNGKYASDGECNFGERLSANITAQKFTQEMTKLNSEGNRLAVSRYHYEDENATKQDMMNGNYVQPSIDDVDFALYCGHGMHYGFSYVPRNALHYYTTNKHGAHHIFSDHGNPDSNLMASEVEWGKPGTRTKWVVTYTCNFLNEGSANVDHMMEGVHMVMGYGTSMYIDSRESKLFGSMIRENNYIRSSFYWSAMQYQTQLAHNVHASVCFANISKFDTITDFSKRPPGISTNPDSYEIYFVVIEPIDEQS